MQGNRSGCDALLDACQGYAPSYHLMGIWPMAARAELAVLPVAVSSAGQPCQAEEQLYCFPRSLWPRQEPYEPCTGPWLLPPDCRTRGFPSLQEPALSGADSSLAAIPAAVLTQVKLSGDASAARAGRVRRDAPRAGKSQSNIPESANAANYFYLANCLSCPWMMRRNNLLYYSAAKSVLSRCRSGKKWWEGLASTNSSPRSI